MIIALLYSLLFFFTPLIYTSNNSEFFELPKMYFVYGLTIIIFATHVVNVLRRQVPLFRHTIYAIPILTFLASQAVSTYYSIDIHTSIYGYYSRLNGGLLSLCAFTTLYLILSVYINDNLRRKIILSSLISGLIVAVYGIMEHFGIDKNVWVQDVQSRVFSTLGQPNWLAAYLCIILPLALDEAISSKSKVIAAAYSSLFVIYYICLLFTKSKSGIIASLISLGILGIFYLYRRTNLKITAACFAAIAILTLYINNPIRDFLLPATTKTDTVNTNPTLNITPSTDIRKIVWQGSLELWRQFPIFGTGPETFGYAYYWTRPASHNLTSEWNFLYNKAHNEYLNYMATTGTLGIATYLVLILIIIYQIIYSSTPLRVAILASFISILITNAAGFSVVLISLYFFLLSALTFEPITSPPKHNSFAWLLIIFLPISIFLFSKVTSYYLADLTYSQAIAQDDKQDYQSAYNQIKYSVYYRPDEPVYLSKIADITAKLAILSNKDKDQSLVKKYTNNSEAAMNLATSISPFNINLWKEKAQTYYYLSSIDSKYYLYALDSLTKATKLAPTDAMSFYLLGKFYQNVSATDKALENYQQALKLKPNYDYASFAIAKIYFDQKDYGLARPMFEKTLQIAPANIDAQNYLNIIATSSAKIK